MAKYSRTAKISIDIGERTVSIIKTNGSGVIVRAGSAELPGKMPDMADVQYKAILASAIVKAAKTAKVRGKKNCVIVVGGPQIITRRFVWPEMAPEALQLNAESEISHYLPSEVAQYNVDYRVSRHTVADHEGTPVAQLDVLVSAMAKDMAEVLLTAAKMAGFTPGRIDIRENAREKLVYTPSLWQTEKARSGKKSKRPVLTYESDDTNDTDDTDDMFDPNGSFAILNISDPLVNMTVFIDGVFYASRYFGSHVKALVTAGAGPDESEPAPDSSSAPDFDNLFTEVASIIDYIQYRERGFKVGSVLLFGDEKTSLDLMQGLSEYLEIPVFQPTERLSGIFKPPKRSRVNLTCFLDSYGAALVSPVNLSSDLNLKPKKIKRHIFKRIVLPFLCLILILGGLLTAGIYFPHIRILALEAEDQKLSGELARYTVPGDVAALQQEVSYMTKASEDVNGFFLPDGASKVLDAIFSALPEDTHINNVSISDGVISLSGSTDTIDKVPAYIRALRVNAVFVKTNAQIVYSYKVTETPSGRGSVREYPVVDFDIKLILTYAEDAK